MQEVNFKNVFHAICVAVLTVVTVFMFSSLVGCAGSQEYYFGPGQDARKPFLRETPFPPENRDTRYGYVTKGVDVVNPFYRVIRVTVDCGYVRTVTVSGRSVLYIIAESPASKMYKRSCRISEWSYLD